MGRPIRHHPLTAQIRIGSRCALHWGPHPIAAALLYADARLKIGFLVSNRHGRDWSPCGLPQVLSKSAQRTAALLALLKTDPRYSAYPGLDEARRAVRRSRQPARTESVL